MSGLPGVARQSQDFVTLFLSVQSPLTPDLGLDGGTYYRREQQGSKKGVLLDSPGPGMQISLWQLHDWHLQGLDQLHQPGLVWLSFSSQGWTSWKCCGRARPASAPSHRPAAGGSSASWFGWAPADCWSQSGAPEQPPAIACTPAIRAMTVRLGIVTCVMCNPLFSSRIKGEVALNHDAYRANTGCPAYTLVHEHISAESSLRSTSCRV